MFVDMKTLLLVSFLYFLKNNESIVIFHINYNILYNYYVELKSLIKDSVNMFLIIQKIAVTIE